MGGKKPEEYKGVAKFFTFLSDTDRQVDLHQVSGYLPITKAAYEKTKASGFYEKNPILEVPLKELTNKPPTENSRGLRFGDMVQMRDVWAEEIEAALAGKKSAKEALDAAVARGNAMLRQFERTADKYRQRRIAGRPSGLGQRSDTARLHGKAGDLPGKLLPYRCSCRSSRSPWSFSTGRRCRRCSSRFCCRTRSDCRPSSSGSRTTSLCCRRPNIIRRSASRSSSRRWWRSSR